MQKTVNYTSQLTDWRRKRIENFRSKKGISYQEAIDHIMYKMKMGADCIPELDEICDAEFHSSNQPKSNK